MQGTSTDFSNRVIAVYAQTKISIKDDRRSLHTEKNSDYQLISVNNVILYTKSTCILLSLHILNVGLCTQVRLFFFNTWRMHASNEFLVVNCLPYVIIWLLSLIFFPRITMNKLAQVEVYLVVITVLVILHEFTC